MKYGKINRLINVYNLQVQVQIRSHRHHQLKAFLRLTSFSKLFVPNLLIV